MRILLLVASFLVLPLAALLFLQWPLRELVQAHASQANDVGQILFSLYVAIAIPAASRARAHLSSGMTSARPHRWRVWAVFVCVVPWAAFMLWASWPTVSGSLRGLERFPETFNPGYFFVKLALGLLLVLVLWEAVRSVWRFPEGSE
jgi:TRAP-type C4-dicarboxylate transport system permease small subunit